MLLVQSFVIKWTEDSSMAEGAARRLALPEALRFPATRAPESGERWLHSVHYDQAVDFEPYSWLETVDGMGLVEVPLAFPAVEVKLEDGKALVTRPESPEPIAALAPGETAQIRLQAEKDINGHVWLERNVINLAWLEIYDSEIFTKRAFDSRYDDLAEDS